MTEHVGEGGLQPVELRELLAIEVAVDPVVDLDGGRRYVPLTGGTFSGRDGLHGVLLAGGVDWQQVRDDGVLEISAHYALRTDVGEAIEVRSNGIRNAPPEMVDRLARGDRVPPAEYYFRTHIRLSTAAPRLTWMNNLLAISTGMRERDTVHIHVHEVL